MKKESLLEPKEIMSVRFNLMVIILLIGIVIVGWLWVLWAYNVKVLPQPKFKIYAKVCEEIYTPNIIIVKCPNDTYKTYPKSASMMINLLSCTLVFEDIEKHNQTIYNNRFCFKKGDEVVGMCDTKTVCHQEEVENLISYIEEKELCVYFVDGTKECENYSVVETISKQDLTLDWLDENCICYYVCVNENGRIRCPECDKYVCGDYIVEVFKT